LEIFGARDAGKIVSLRRREVFLIEPTRPVLRWHGGKWMLAPWIISHFPEHRVYTEAFGGAASVLLRKPRSYAEIYNDLDGEVVNLFRVLQDPASAERLVNLLRLTPFAREEFELAYQETEDPIERARRLVIVSFMGFGSNGHNTEVRTGFRANSNRSSTTPAHDWANYPDCLRAVIDRLARVVIESKDALELVLQHDQDDALHYVDPPYVHSTRDAGGRQRDYRFEMDDVGHRALAGVLRAAKGGVVLSGYPCPLYEELYGDWHKIERTALADGARKRVEVLWINDSAWSVGGRLI
jgi:DNA adenine methylase